MTDHHKPTGPGPALILYGMTQYQTVGVNAPLKVFALLEVQGVPASEADGLVAALEAGAVAGGQSEVVELGGIAPASRGSPFSDGWNDRVSTVIEPRWASRTESGRGAAGRSAGSGELAVHLADVRQRERAGLVRLERFVRGHVLPRTHPHTMARRRALEALGEAGGLCTARTRNADGDVIVCTLDAGHYDVDDKPSFKDAKPGRWHKADASVWNDLGAACIPHPTL